MTLNPLAPLRRSGHLMWVVVVAVLLALLQWSGFVTSLENRFYDGAVALRDPQPSERIVVLAIDERSIAQVGRWPWSRDVHAQLIDRLVQGGAQTVVHTALFLEPQRDRGLDHIMAIRDLAGRLPAEPGQLALMERIGQAELALDADRRLAESLRAAQRVLIPSIFGLGTPVGPADQPLPAFAIRHSVIDREGFATLAHQTQQPVAALGEAAAGIGHLNAWRDSDGSARQDLLWVNYYGRAVPSLALLAAAHSLKLPTGSLKLQPPDGVWLGPRWIPTDADARIRPQFYQGDQGRSAFVTDSVADVLNGHSPATRYAGKIVLVGATAAGIGEQMPVPGHAGLAPVELLAHVTSSLLQGHQVVQPGWTRPAAAGVLGVVLAFLAWGLPRLSAGAGAWASGGLFFALQVLSLGLLLQADVWWPLMWPSLALLLGYLGLTTHRYLGSEAGLSRADQESAETNRMMGLALLGQGQLDMAFDRFRRVPLQPALMDNLAQLALDFERKRLFNRALAVYEHMAGLDPHHKDLPSRLQRARSLSETLAVGGGRGGVGPRLLLQEGLERPMLGRYQIDRELGKGAMGIVYQGRDPTIGRVVAIKTMALGEEFEGAELNEARERFFREAETAGRLQHQHIVTIFDAGEEHDLAFIAMEFLKGSDLSAYTKPDQLLPAPEVVSLLARVARALDYAHAHQVVHRDIKPANIMYDRSTQTVKVTDFGIARITDASRTKTGMVLGTPSYMPPEQLAGLKVDGRADLYALGVMGYQLLCGQLPFRAQTMSELMYRIANEEAEPLQTLCPHLPLGLCQIIHSALAKDPLARPESGQALADRLLQVEWPPQRQEAATGAHRVDNPGFDPFAATVRSGAPHDSLRPQTP